MPRRVVYARAPFEAPGGNIVYRRSIITLATMALLCLGVSSYARADEITGVRVPGLSTGVDRYDDLVINVKK
jgi:hypothetical protein